MCRSSTSSPRGVHEGVVLGNEKLCHEHYLLKLRVSSFPPTQPGQFVQLQCRPPVEQVGWAITDWPADRPPKFSQPELTDREPLLRRPFSLAGRRDLAAGAELEIIYRTVGTGTYWLAAAGEGDRLSLIGPLGNALPIRPNKPKAILVGGGVGIPPMIYLAHALKAAGKTTVAFNGVRSRSLLPLRGGCEPPSEKGLPSLCSEEFALCDAQAVIASDDGSVGYRGLVTAAVENWLDSQRISPDELVVYSCGPELMMQAVGEMCIERGIECYLSLERNMACGMGTCQSCVVKIRDVNDRGWSYKLCCTDGPVFDARDVVWE